MDEVLIDSDILSFYFKGDEKVVKNIERYLEDHDEINLSIITYYEILSGLKYKNANKQIIKFEKFISKNKLLFLTKKSTEISAEKYDELRNKGKTIGNSDLLIAGVALEHNLTLVTNNEKDFKNISGLKIENWKKIENQKYLNNENN